MIKVGGAGPGNEKYFTEKLIEEINAADKVIAFERIGESAKKLRSDVIIIKKVSEALDYMKNKDEYVLLLASGDPLFYGIVDYLKKKGVEISEVIAGITSVQYFFSRIQKPFSDVRTKSVHGKVYDFSEIERDSTYVFLIDGEHNASYISKELSDRGFRGKLYCGYNLSYDDEQIIELKIGEEMIEPSILGVVVTEFEVD